MDAGQTPEAVAVEERRPQPVLSIRHTVEPAQLTQAQGQSLRQLWSLIHRRGVKPAGPPFVRYHTFGDMGTDLEVGIPVVDASSGEGQVAAGELPGGAAVTTWSYRITRWAGGRLRPPGGLAEGKRARGGWRCLGGLHVDRSCPGAEPISVARAFGVAHAVGTADQVTSPGDDNNPSFAAIGSMLSSIRICRSSDGSYSFIRPTTVAFARSGSDQSAFETASTNSSM
jgi:hypothetical protein